MIIRRMRPEDLDETVAVWERARWESLPWLEERMGYSHRDNLGFFRDRVIVENEVWLAVEGDAIVGLLAVQPGRLDRLYVEPGLQRQGIGTALLHLRHQPRPRERARRQVRVGPRGLSASQSGAPGPSDAGGNASGSSSDAVDTSIRSPSG